MKKLLIMGLLILVLGKVSLSADTWKEYMQRANTMSNRFGECVTKTNYTSWSTDKWGALMATTFWLEVVFEDIYRNAPNLYTRERDLYYELWQSQKKQSDSIYYLLNSSSFNDSTKRAIVNRWEYWEKYLKDGGLIKLM